MGYITKKNEIPSWFSPERYENIRSGDLQQVYDELTLRKMVHTDLNDKLFKSDSDRQSYFNKSLGENYDAKDPQVARDCRCWCYWLRVREYLRQLRQDPSQRHREVCSFVAQRR